jgi:hypothetical protein
MAMESNQQRHTGAVSPAAGRRVSETVAQATAGNAHGVVCFMHREIGNDTCSNFPEAILKGLRNWSGGSYCDVTFRRHLLFPSSEYGAFQLNVEAANSSDCSVLAYQMQTFRNSATHLVSGNSRHGGSPGATVAAATQWGGMSSSAGRYVAPGPLVLHHEWRLASYCNG